MRLTIKDIAAEANVSVSTVSKCLNGYTDISGETREHVLETIRRMDYVPNTFARYVASKATSEIGLTVPDVKDPYFAQSTYGIETALKKEGYHLFMGNLDRNERNLIEFLRRAREMRFDGLIITPDSWSNELVNMINNMDMPVLSIRRRPPEKCHIPYIDVDHIACTRTMLNYLYSIGHRKIAHAVLSNEAGILRAQAYTSFCEEKGLEDRTAASPIPASILSDAVRNGEEACRMIMAQWPDTTAIFCGSDFIAIGIFVYLKKIGLSVPEDISVVGIGNCEEARLPWFDLTTMELHRFEMGQAATEMLHQMIEGEKVENKLCKASLIVRGSSRRVEH